MKKRILAFFLILSVTALSLGTFAFAEENEVVILFESDVHCAVAGYAKLSAMKKEILKSGNFVGVVSSGDFIQGGSLGAATRGKYITDIMNIVGYDAVTLGNHEFDYKTARLFELAENLNAPVVCSNFKKTDSGETVFKPYTIVSYGDTDIAYIGITTPDTITSSSPAQFRNDNGAYIYDFSGETLYETVQNSINAAKEEGADYIIALSHLGTENVYEKWSAQTLVKNTAGLNVVLDGHSHSVVSGMKVKDKEENDVIISSTGTKFENIGKLTLKDGELKTELISMEEYEKTDDETSAYIEKINEEYQEAGARKIGESKVKLLAADDDGNRIIRLAETNLGDFCADAYRLVTGADIGLINGGGIRADINAGDVTFNDLLSVFPYNNETYVASLTGGQIADLLEFGLMYYPIENGEFQHVSGITYDFDPQKPSTVTVNENNEFVEISGERRVSNIKVLDGETGKYLPIREDKAYSVASHGYLLKECGGGMAMLKNTVELKNVGIIDVELLENYILENLGGVIGEEYKAAGKRINMLEEYIPLRKSFEEKGFDVIWRAEEPKKIVVNAKGGTIIFIADTNSVSVNGEEFLSDRVAYIENGTTYISADCMNFCQ